MYGSGNFSVAYQHSFVYIRELAVQLRNAVGTLSKDAIQKVYGWQYLCSLHLWVDLISEHAHNETMKHLVYPLIQILFGVVGFTHGSRYLPYRFRCIRMLNKLSRAAGVFVNCTGSLLDVLEHQDLRKKPTDSKLKYIELENLLKLPKSTLSTKVFKDKALELTVDLLMENLATFSHSIAFPELVFPVLRRLKKYFKACKVPPFSKLVKSLVDVVESNVSFIESKRANVSFAPKDTKSIIQFSEKSESPLLTAFKARVAKSKGKKQIREMERKQEDALLREAEAEGTMTKKSKRRDEDEDEEMEEEEMDEMEEEEMDEMEEEEVQERPKQKKRKAEKPKSGKAKKQRQPMGQDEIDDLSLSDIE